MSTPSDQPDQQQAEQLFFALLSGHFQHILEHCLPLALESAIREINSMLNFAKNRNVETAKSATLLTQNEIILLVQTLTPVCEKGQQELARRLLKSELDRHKIPNDL